MTTSQRWLRALAVMWCCFLSGCETVSYYSQAISGQLSLLRQRQEISTLLQDPALPPLTRHQLKLVQQVRTFAAQELGLPVADKFATYVELHREFVVWNVFAAEEFSTTPRQWCYPIAGCVAYRGYFSEAAAQHYAQQLQAEGWDTYVGGIGAYSTLGWFDDPVVSSMLRRDDTQLAAVLIHELAHGLIYVAGDTEFNESFATTVEQEGLQRWLQQPSMAAEHAELVQAAEVARQRQQQFVELVQTATAELDALYKKNENVEALRQHKQARLAQLRTDYQAIRQSWGDYSGYDRWFADSLNNAQLSTVQTYNELVPAFQRLLQNNGDDLKEFYKAVARLSKLATTERAAQLKRL